MRINRQYCTPQEMHVATGGDQENGGMAHPALQHLRAGPGHYYYRFASSNRPTDVQQGGGWWIEYETFAKIREFARAAARDGSGADARRESVRYCLALPFSWTLCDRLIRANFSQELDAYRGTGKIARGYTSKSSPDGGGFTRYIPPQHISELYQLYIPGMRYVAKLVLSNVSNEFLWASPHFK